MNTKRILIIIMVLLTLSCTSNMRQLAQYTNQYDKTLQIQRQYMGSQPSNVANICQIFAEKPDWHQAARKISTPTKIKIPNVMAFMYQESKFKATARPLIKGTNKVNGTAYGFAQVLKSTWDYYKKKVGKPNVKRDNFYDSYEFIVWYMIQTNKVNSVDFNDVASHYLNYHEGWTGFKKKTFLKKPWLLGVSKKVSNMKNKFSQQYSQCQNKSIQATDFNSAKNYSTTDQKYNVNNNENINTNYVLKSYNTKTVWF